MWEFTALAQPPPHVPYPKVELGHVQVCSKPKTLAQLRAVLHEPSTARSQAVLAHWTDQLGVWLDERKERERLATVAREKEKKEKEERELEATAAREKEEKEREEREATAREKEGSEMTAAKAEAVEEEEGEDAETQRVSLACASEPQTVTSEAPKPPA